ncbi:mechanosensitive ion channel family protein [Alteromonas aestuariivivens]|uniref:Mechanosensitive ion channel family protein n=1 Tax=Alteromonas aestuariivivens TaxID=1938339 RepID=A0A3D8M373_9ALTE|nr:mechanosensitive ion channel domain-containing protein [Alteromonas aestuariivivens]RDV24005.1 mechanosensitive ion channel family protein [Alteromonas aestuariivivens]
MELALPLRDRFLQLLKQVLPNLTSDSVLYHLIALCTILLFAATLYFVCRWLLIIQISAWVKRSKNSLDDTMYSHGLFRRLLHLIPALTIFLLTSVLLQPESLLNGFLNKTSMLYMLLATMAAIYALLNTVEDKYNESRLAQKASITGFIQVAKLFVAIVVLLLSVSLVIDKSPLIIVSGLTALAAVLLLIFRDTILGFVAGIQITANRMFNTGDWIQINKFEVDGEIQEIGLTNVKVQNWDKTISTLPTYSLTNEAVKNWRGMQQSGGRRIKRAIFIDVHSIRLCSGDMLERFGKIRFISEYIEQKIEELRTYHKDSSIDESDLLNARRLTNIGTFRAYLEAYLRKHPQVNQSLTLMVRQLPPSELGLPLEIYCFSADKDWVRYEKIQADIFDHVLAMLPQFDLRAFQRDTHQAAVMPISQQ